MSRLRFCLLFAVIYSCSHFAQAIGDETIIIPLDKKTTTTPAPDTTTETTTPPTTSTTSTTPPTTSTSSTTPSTTTSTTPSTTTSTTPAPTTTPVPPTSTPAPGPMPNPNLGSWNYTEGNKTCIVTQFAAQLNVTYNKVVDSATTPWSVVLNVPANATVLGGNCSGDQWITISWPSTNDSMPNNMTIVYHFNGTANSYGVKSFNISLAPDNFVNASSSDPIDLYHGSEWETPLATSYRCKVPISLNMTSDAVSAASQLTLFSLQEEAYRTTPGTGFSAARECGGGDVPDAVPIAVGCALGGLVVVVLIAYLVGRRRSAARGYLSM